MKTLLKSIKDNFYKSSSVIHSKCKTQWAHVRPGASWSAPDAMANFMRELHVISGGTLKLSYHGEGSKMGIEEGNVVDGLFPQAVEVEA
jgi:hypothetical protein